MTIYKLKLNFSFRLYEKARNNFNIFLQFFLMIFFFFFFFCHRHLNFKSMVISFNKRSLLDINIFTSIWQILVNCNNVKITSQILEALYYKIKKPKTKIFILGIRILKVFDNIHLTM